MIQAYSRRPTSGSGAISRSSTPSASASPAGFRRRRTGSSRAASCPARSTSAPRPPWRSSCSGTTGDAESITREVVRVMQATEGVTDITVSRDANYPQVESRFDREKAASVSSRSARSPRRSSSPSARNASINPSIFTDRRPATSTTWSSSSTSRTGRRCGISDGSSSPRRQSPVLLSTVAEIKQSSGPVEIERKYQQRLVRVAANTLAVTSARSPPSSRTSSGAWHSRRASRCASRTERAAARGVRQPLLHVGARDHPGLHGAGLAVQVAQGSAHDHVLRCRWA